MIFENINGLLPNNRYIAEPYTYIYTIFYYICTFVHTYVDDKYVRLPCDIENMVLPSGDNFTAVTSLYKIHIRSFQITKIVNSLLFV